MNRRRLRSFILAFMPQLGIGIHQGLIAEGVLKIILGSLKTSIPDCRIICVIKQPNGSPVVFSSRASSIILRICLHKQKANLMMIAYKN
jgi:hypothetical protein